MINIIQFAICDDEPVMAQKISDHLSRYMDENQVTDYLVSRFLNGHTLLESGYGFDVIFLDIQMEQPDGLETARLLRQRGFCGLLIFVTVLKECVFDAFGVEAYDYLLKPLDSGHFQRTMDRVLKRLKQQAGESIVIQRGAACEVVLLSEIVYCEVQGRKLYLHRTDETVVDYYGRLEELARRVDRRFFQCHRSYLVNLDCVRGCQNGQVMLSGGMTIPVSRLRERGLIQALLTHMKERDF